MMAGAMRYRLDEIERRYEELTRELATPEVASDPARLRDLGKQHAELHAIVTAARSQRDALRQVDEWRQMAKEERDQDLAAELRQEAEAAERQAEAADRRLEEL